VIFDAVIITTPPMRPGTSSPWATAKRARTEWIKARADPVRRNSNATVPVSFLL
jgi:hypothetical protein